MKPSRNRSGSPVWLRDRYIELRLRTVGRVEAAINSLLKSSDAISLRQICRRARELDGNPLSETTITGNPEAYAIYQRHQTRKARRPSHSEIHRLCRGLSDHEARAIKLRHASLKKRLRDELIRDVLVLEATVSKLETEAVLAREEILRLHEMLRSKARPTRRPR